MESFQKLAMTLGYNQYTNMTPKQLWEPCTSINKLFLFHKSTLYVVVVVVFLDTVP